jgi:hypothetical protein
MRESDLQAIFLLYTYRVDLKAAEMFRESACGSMTLPHGPSLYDKATSSKIRMHRCTQLTYRLAVRPEESARSCCKCKDMYSLNTESLVWGELSPCEAGSLDLHTLSKHVLDAPHSADPSSAASRSSATPQRLRTPHPCMPALVTLSEAL